MYCADVYASLFHRKRSNKCYFIRLKRTFVINAEDGKAVVQWLNTGSCSFEITARVN